MVVTTAVTMVATMKVVATMTNSGKPRRSAPTYNGLKALLLATGLAASILGTWMIAAEEARQSSLEEAVPVVVEAAGSGFDPSALQPIPTAILPQMALPTLPPTEIAASAAAGAGSPSAQGGSAPAAAGAASGANQPAFAIPTAVAVGPLPALPPAGGSAPAAGGGGGGGNGGGGNGGGGGGSSS